MPPPSPSRSPIRSSRFVRLWPLAVIGLQALLVVWPILRVGGVPAPLNHMYSHDLVFRQELLRLQDDPAFMDLPIHAWTGDIATMFHPWYELGRAAAGEGRVPLWNPHQLCGYPIYANWQFAPLDPLTLITYPLPLATGMTVRLLLRLLVAATGCYALARLAGCSRAASVLAATVFSLSGTNLGWLSYSLGAAAVWMPWQLVATVRLHRRGRVRDIALLGLLFTASYLAGHVELSFIAGVVASLVALTLARGAPQPGRRVGRFALAAVLGAVGAAVQVLPFEEGMRWGWLTEVRQGDASWSARIGAAARGRRPLLDVLSGEIGTVVFPGIAGSPVRFDSPEPRKSPNLVESNAYAGLLPLALVLAAVVCAPRPSLRLLLPAAFALGVALQLPVFDLVNLLPIFSLMPPGRWRFVWVLGVALVAALGLDALARADRVGVRRWRRWSLAAIAGGTLVVAAVLARLEILGVRWAGSTAIAVAFACAGALVVWVLAIGRLRLAPGWLATLAIALTTLDLLAHGFGLNTWVLPRHAAIEPATVAFLRAQPGVHRIGRAAPALLVPNAAMRWGLDDADGYDAIYPFFVRDLWHDAAMGIDAPAHVLRNERFILAPSDSPAVAAVSGLRRVFSDGSVDVFESAEALPRAFLARHVRHLATDAEVRLALGTVDLTATLVTTDPTLQSLPGKAAAGDAVTIERHEAEHVVVRTVAAAPAHLVLLDTYYPGWTATVDGATAPIHRVHHGFRAVTVPAGEHRVEMSFVPWRWSVGKWISGVTVLGLLILLALGPRHRRQC